MERLLIACSMMEDEINRLYKELNCQIPVIWIERGYHNTPAKLKEKLQQVIDEHPECEEILFTFGLCGNGTAGLVSRHSRLILPRFDDCLNLMLCVEERKQRALTETGSIYLTKGWIQDQEAILSQYERTVEEYGEETAEAVMEMMYENYEKISVIDTGCYDLTPVLEYAQKAAQLLDLSTQVVAGSTNILKKLLLGEWDRDFIIQPSGQPLYGDLWELPAGD